MTTLRDRWRADVLSGGESAVDPASVADAGERLIDRWREPHRRYHTAVHLVAVLDGVDRLVAGATDPPAVRLAAWFHDAVYQGRPGQDEEESALLAERELLALGWARGRCEEVARLVRATADHGSIGMDDANAAVLADADLAVLAAAEENYLAYAGAVRAEYAHVPDDLFRAGRIHVLTRLLESGSLYRTPEAARLWTAAARSNIRAEVTRLTSGPARA